MIVFNEAFTVKILNFLDSIIFGSAVSYYVYEWH